MSSQTRVTLGMHASHSSDCTLHVHASHFSLNQHAPRDSQCVGPAQAGRRKAAGGSPWGGALAGGHWARLAANAPVGAAAAGGRHDCAASNGKLNGTPQGTQEAPLAQKWENHIDSDVLATA